MVDQRDPRVDADPGGQVPAGDRPRRLQRPLGSVDHRADPQRLGDDRVEVGVVAVVELVAQARRASPGCGAAGRRPKASPVAVVSWPAASIVISSSRSSTSVIGRPSSSRARSSSESTSVRSSRSGSRAPPLDLLVEQRVGPLEPPPEPAARAEAPVVARAGARARRRAICVSITASIASRRRSIAVGLVDAEHGPADHLEGQVRASARASRTPVPIAPAIDLGLGDLADHRPHRGQPTRPGTAAAAACAGAGARARRGRAPSGRRAPPPAARSPRRRAGRTGRR